MECSRAAEPTASTACPPPVEATAANAVSSSRDETGTAETNPASLALARRVRALGLHLGDSFVSGISVGLPNSASGRRVFDSTNLQALLRGESLIEPLPRSLVQAQLARNVVQVSKSPTGERLRRPLSALQEVVQIASRIGGFDLAADFGVDPRIVETLDTTYALAIGAGLQALQDAGLVDGPPSSANRHRRSASEPNFHAAAAGAGGGVGCGSGAPLPGSSGRDKPWRLDKRLRDETGVIFAASFPALDSLVDELSRFMTDGFARATGAARRSLAVELEAHAMRLDPPARQALLDLCAGLLAGEPVDLDAAGGASPAGAKSAAVGAKGAPAAAANGVNGAGDGGGAPLVAGTRYEFNRKLLFKLLVMANSQLAELVGARGPNLHINAACAGTTAAISLACDWLRAGRCARVVVISADNPSSDSLMPWIGTGFLALGAASTRASAAEAALPFDKRRNGMILGAGAVGLVLETDTALASRPAASPRAKVLGTVHTNSAFHASAIGTSHAAETLEALLQQVEAVHGLTRTEIADALLYFSHETCTHARGGGCAGAELTALRATFGTDTRKIIITNTKGMTGHAMGVCFEDAVAVASLSSGFVPPVINHEQADPLLGSLRLSEGGTHDAKYALHFAAGFGSQVSYVLYARC